MESCFPSLKLARSCALSLSNDPSYVLLFATQRERQQEEEEGDDTDTKPLFAAAVSGTNEIKVYSQDAFCIHRSLSGHSSCITGIKFDVKNPNIIWSASLDCTLRYWNLQENNPKGVIIAKLEDGFTSVNISCDGALLVAGTEKKVEEIEVFNNGQSKVESNVKLQIWDIRNLLERPPKNIATFDSCHSDDVTEILFHPSNPKVLLTGSTDGLVTVLDLTTYDEEDALLQTMNTESSVSTFGFFGPCDEFLYVITHVEALQIWKYMEGTLLSSMSDLRAKADKSTPIDFVIDCLYHKDSKRLFVVAGTHSGSLEIMHLNLDVLEPFQSLKGGHSATVRCLLYQNMSLLTGAEDGMVCHWRALENGEKVKINKKKQRKEKKARKNPYKKAKH